MVMPTPAPSGMMPVPSAIPPGSMESGAVAVLQGLDPAVAFFLGGALVIFVLISYEACRGTYLAAGAPAQVCRRAQPSTDQMQDMTQR